MRAMVSHRAPVVGTSDVANEIGISRQATEKHLRRLVDEGKVDTHKIGQARIWWPTTEGRELLS